jgi:hypothetical protein
MKLTPFFLAAGLLLSATASAQTPAAKPLPAPTPMPAIQTEKARTVAIVLSTAGGPGEVVLIRPSGGELTVKIAESGAVTAEGGDVVRAAPGEAREARILMRGADGKTKEIVAKGSDAPAVR